MVRGAWQATVLGVWSGSPRTLRGSSWCSGISGTCSFYCYHPFVASFNCCCLVAAAAAAAKSLQLCLTLWDPIDSSLLGSSVPGILQARILEWVAISLSNTWKWKVKLNSPSRAVWVMSNSLWPHGLQHVRLACSSPSPGVCSNSCPLSRWCYLTISSSAVPLSFCPQSFQHQGL